VEVDLLTYGSGEDVEIPGVRVIRIPRFRFLGTPKVGPSFLKLFLDVFIAMWTVGLLLRRRYLFVHAHEESVFICLFLKPIFRFKLVYDMHSSLPQQLTNFGFTNSRILHGLFDWLERRCLQASDVVITICPDLANYATSQMPDVSRHFLIENSLFDDVRLKDPSQKGDEQASAISSDGPLVVYAGTFERYQGIDLLIRGFADIISKIPDATLLLVGGSSEQVERYRRLSDECGLNGSCVFTGRVSPRVAQQYVRAADVVVSPRVEGTNTPLKIYADIAHGAPLVATRIHAHTQVLNDDVCLLVEPQPQSMGQGILTVLEDEERRTRASRAARRLYEQNYSRSVYEEKMIDVLKLVTIE
jgi:glycosyltransferase involved in cell wall biosynthesis